jgi:hypothetical protein
LNRRKMRFGLFGGAAAKQTDETSDSQPANGGISTASSSSPRRRKSRIRRYGSARAAGREYAPRLRAGSISCSTSWLLSTSQQLSPPAHSRPVDKWYELIGNPTHADAILDRLVHNAHRINLPDHYLRRTRSNSTQGLTDPTIQCQKLIRQRGSAPWATSCRSHGRHHLGYFQVYCQHWTCGGALNSRTDSGQ